MDELVEVSTAREPPRVEGLRALAQEIADCTRCPLHRTRSQVVIYRGGERPRVVFVGEAPGASEDLAGLPFVGRSGRRLDAAIAQVGLGVGEYGILNVVKCRPPSNRFDRAAAEACRPFLDRQLALLRPELIVSLGAQALSTLDPTAPPVTQAAGSVRLGGPVPLFPLLHPAAAMHAPRLKERWATDVERLRAFLAEGAA